MAHDISDEVLKDNLAYISEHLDSLKAELTFLPGDKVLLAVRSMKLICSLVATSNKYDRIAKLLIDSGGQSVICNKVASDLRTGYFETIGFLDETLNNQVPHRNELETQIRYRCEGNVKTTSTQEYLTSEAKRIEQVKAILQL